ncbi:hypothetical protein EYF80_009102 [Liparis tanakae]|uniref:Uncharacterized protein n=1 Tax=Liparis tanakae TaxID=230148 RepID=A0A4Z2IRZ4_9TELE|nr:hypothetical protein EYF80_009102 [Liparis tanakae]
MASPFLHSTADIILSDTRPVSGFSLLAGTAAAQAALALSHGWHSNLGGMEVVNENRKKKKFEVKVKPCENIVYTENLNYSPGARRRTET